MNRRGLLRDAPATKALLFAATAGLLAGMATGSPAVASAPPPHATAGSQATLLTAIRAAHHSGYDRIVFEFNRPAAPPASVSRVTRLVGDFSGQTVPVPGRAVIRVILRGAQAHTDAGRPTVDLDQAFALPNVMSLRGGGDFEAVVTLGIGLAIGQPYHVHKLTNPGRIVIDVNTNFQRKTSGVYFQDSRNYAAGRAPYLRLVRREVPAGYPVTGLLDRIFAGPTNAEEGSGLRVVRSRATGFASVSVASGIARLRLTGGCDSRGSTFTIASHIMPTLRALPNVSWVKIYYPAGFTGSPTGNRDSIPACLEP